MAWYQSGIPSSPPGVAMPKIVSPYQYPGANADVVRSMGQGAQARQELNAQQSDANYNMQRQQQMQNLVLGGLTQQNQAMQNRQQIGTAQLGVLNDLLTKLYR